VRFRCHCPKSRHSGAHSGPPFPPREGGWGVRCLCLTFLLSSFCAAGELIAPPAAQLESPKNILRVSRLPLGLQSGWAIDQGVSDGDDIEIIPDPDTRGPSGVPALLIRPVTSTVSSLISTPLKMLSDEEQVKTFALYAEPFPISTNDVHTASLYIKGAPRAKLLVIADGKVLGQKLLDTRNTERWQRIELPFKPAPQARAYAMRLEAGGKFWIDALQVEHGPVATDYASGGLCEVSLAVDSPARVLFDDEKPEIQYMVSGEPGGGSLKLKLVNLYGEEWMLPAAELNRDFLQKGKFRFDDGRPAKPSQGREIFADRPLGAFRIEAWVENQRNERISPLTELVVYRLRRPHYWKKDAPQSPFGIHTLSTTRHILMAKAAGVNWTRLHDAGTEYTGWYHLERAAGEWTFADREIARYRTHGMKVLGVLATTPEWASTLQRKRNGYFDRYYEPRRVDDFAHYVKTVTKRYKDSVGSWEIWNEPWAPQFWHSSFDAAKGKDSYGYVAEENAAERYAELMQVAHKTAKNVDKTLAVVGINTAAGQSDWSKALTGSLKHCDIISYHHYHGGGVDPAIIEKATSQTLAPLADASGRVAKPVWMTEGALNSVASGGSFYNHTLPYKDADDPVAISDALCRYVVSLLSQNVRKVFLYSMHTHSHFGAKSLQRVLVTEEGYLHPSAAAHSALAWQLEDTDFIRSVELAEGVSAFVFEGKERAVAVLMKRGAAEYVLPRSREVETVDLFGNPLASGELLGNTLVYISARNMKQLAKTLPQVAR